MKILVQQIIRLDQWWRPRHLVAFTYVLPFPAGGLPFLYQNFLLGSNMKVLQLRSWNIIILYIYQGTRITRTTYIEDYLYLKNKIFSFASYCFMIGNIQISIDKKVILESHLPLVLAPRFVNNYSDSSTLLIAHLLRVHSHKAFSIHFTSFNLF